MIIKRIDGTTRVLGQSQGYCGLPIRDILLDDGTPCMQCAWEPTPEELLKLLAGAPIILSVLGTTHPPVVLAVGLVPGAEEKAPG